MKMLSILNCVGNEPYEKVKRGHNFFVYKVHLCQFVSLRQNGSSKKKKNIVIELVYSCYAVKVHDMTYFFFILIFFSVKALRSLKTFVGGEAND